MSGLLVKAVLDFCESRWPLENAESWDKPGLITGSPARTVDKIVLAIDATADVLSEVPDNSLLLVHHPLLLKGVYSAAETSPKGYVLSEAIRRNISIYAAHTNADVVHLGVSDVFARLLGLNKISPLVANSLSAEGHGRVGMLPKPLTLGALAKKLANILPSTATGVRVAGKFESQVEKVALCAGAGDSFLPQVLNSDADVYITSDLRHHPAQDFIESQGHREKKIALIDISHWAAEWLWLTQASLEISEAFPDVIVEVNSLNTDPWNFTITQ
jgi:dinuclear metal center YbgI/SA1388 family protein